MNTTLADKIWLVVSVVGLAAIAVFLAIAAVIEYFGILIWIFLSVGAFVVGSKSSSSDRLTFICALIAFFGVAGLCILFYDSSFVEWLFAPFGNIEGAEGLSSALWEYTLALQAYYFVAAPFAVSFLARQL